MSLSQELYDLNVARAGSDFEWASVKGCTLVRVQVHGLREALRQAQGGLCAACGEELNEYGEMCHVVSGGRKSRGWMPGNIYLGHIACNEADRTHGPIVPLASLLRADLILTEWPDASERTARGLVAQAKASEAVNLKRQARGL